MHNFHIPVMGLGFTIDTPLKVAHYGINSVVSIVDDDLIEKMRKVHCNNSNTEYVSISTKEPDYRAKRVMAYLNLLDILVEKNFKALKAAILDKSSELEKYRNILPDSSALKGILKSFNDGDITREELEPILEIYMVPGNIDVNIMTKVDKPNYEKGILLPVEFNDAHSALRGFANSTVKSSLVLSAGMNQRLYSYLESLPCFFPDENGKLKKKITLKVSDYRSALIQGKFLAKKGIWVSEYRIESGLNCGGHAFATDGYLMGPILEEFKNNLDLLISSNHEIYSESLKRKNLKIPLKPFNISISAQGGVGTSEEHNFLLDYYNVNSVGWGTPFLLVPEATNVDDNTLKLLSDAKEEDLYLSNISPLGVPFNSLRGNTKDIEKMALVKEGRPGSSCPKKFLISNTEFSEKPICTASSKFQSQKIAELNSSLACKEEHEKSFNSIIDKSCLCVGLATSALQVNNAATKADGTTVLICPGPNLAYFSSIVSLREMVDHIYGRINIIVRNDRPNMFMKELKLYLDYLKERVSEISIPVSKNQAKYFETFQSNISDGIQYYKSLVSGKFNNMKSKIDNELTVLEESFNDIKKGIVLLTEELAEAVNVNS